MTEWMLAVVICCLGIVACLVYIAYLLVKSKRKHKRNVEQYEWLDDDTLVIRRK